VRIKDIPQEHRPRERFKKMGAEALSTAELFAILLRTGSKNENVIDMSHRLIAEYGLDKLFECSLKELQKIKGIGPAKAMQILTMHEILKRIGLSQNPVNKITCAGDVFKYCSLKLKGMNKEHFMILHLNAKNHILKDEIVSIGTLTSAITHPREIFKSAIKESAYAVILVHNHPSGDPTPSEEDKTLTEKFFEAGELLGIKVLDHVIVGKDIWWSFKEN